MVTIERKFTHCILRDEDKKYYVDVDIEKIGNGIYRRKYRLKLDFKDFTGHPATSIITRYELSEIKDWYETELKRC